MPTTTAPATTRGAPRGWLARAAGIEKKKTSPLGTNGTAVSGVNSAGQIVGYYFDGSTRIHGFLYSGGTYTTLDDPLGIRATFASGINDAGQIVGTYADGNGNEHGFLATLTPNPPPPAGTTADMILRHGADGQYEIYDIGNNAILAGYSLGQVGTDWQFVGLGGFNGADTTDMVLRSSSTGAFEVYDISNNNITSAGSLGSVGLNWQFGGFGDFSGDPGETDMILRNTANGALEVYDIVSNTLAGAASLGSVGLDWQVGGFAADPPTRLSSCRRWLVLGVAAEQ
jgi:probable HAF family extracellular repeat protein